MGGTDVFTATDFHGLYAIIPTPAVTGAERIDAVNTVDLVESARLVERLLADGAHALIALGTTGECPTLAPEDYDAFVDCVMTTVKGRVPTFIGATALGAHEALRRLRFVQDRGATGSLLGLPMWQPLTTEMAVRYYAEISEALPDLAIMAYANARAFRYTFPAGFWAGVAEKAPTVTSAKFSNPAQLAEFQAASQGRVHFLPIDQRVHEFYAIAPETTTACWATAAAMGPEPSLAIIDAIAAKDQARIHAAAGEIAWANEPIDSILGNPELFAHYNIQVEKLRMEAAGYCRPGPARPPYDVIPDEHAEAARECGRRWVKVCERCRGECR
ncbi:MAG: dihydrodipicolinate synthase family protein [Acidimicrobiia bacterium]